MTRVYRAGTAAATSRLNAASARLIAAVSVIGSPRRLPDGRFARGDHCLPVRPQQGVPGFQYDRSPNRPLEPQDLDRQPVPDRGPLAEVVAPFDGPTGARICLLGRVACSDKDPCPAHGRWKSVSNEVSTFFRETKVSDLLESPVARVTRKPPTAR